MKYLVVLGSPNSNGYGNFLINKIRQSLSKEDLSIELDIFYVSKTEYRLCKGCSRCFIDGDCKLTNIDNYDFYNKLMKYKGIIFLVPSYVHQMPAVLKNCFDRMANRMHEFPFIGKKVILISYSNSNGERELANYLTSLFNSLGSEVVSSIAFNRYYGNENELLEKIKESLFIMKERIEGNKFLVTKSQERLFDFIKSAVNTEIENNIITFKHKRWKELLEYNSLVEYLKNFKFE